MISYYELLGMIKEGKIPSKIRVKLCSYSCDYIADYEDEEFNYYFKEDENKKDDVYTYFLSECFIESVMFNKCIEIIEEQDIEYEDICEWGKEAIKDIKTNERYKTGGLENYVSVLAKTQNEIIRNQQKIIKEVKKLKNK